MAGINKLGLIGKRVLIIFYDGANTTSRREGILIEQNGEMIYIKNNDNLIEGIPLGRVIRIKEV